MMSLSLYAHDLPSKPRKAQVDQENFYEETGAERRQGHVIFNEVQLNNEDGLIAISDDPVLRNRARKRPSTKRVTKKRSEAKKAKTRQKAKPKRNRRSTRRR